MRIFGPLGYVLLGIAVTAAAQIVLKSGTRHVPLEGTWFAYIGTSLFLYGLSFLTYYLALRYYDISTIQPIMTVSIMAIIAIYGLLAGEAFGSKKAIGIVLGVASVFFISRP
jgi:drug/metabolite transporter (DMT)-like permease